jgi:hypothetical protein
MHAAVGATLSSSSSLGTEDILYLILLAGGNLPIGSYLLPCSEARGQGGDRDAAQEVPNDEQMLHFDRPANGVATLREALPLPPNGGGGQQRVTANGCGKALEATPCTQ